MHGLKIVCSQKHDDEIEGRVYFNPLSETFDPFSTGLDGIIPNGPPPIEAIFDNSGTTTQLVEFDFQEARPPILKPMPV